MIGLILRYRVQLAGLWLVGIMIGVGLLLWGPPLSGAPPGALEVALPERTPVPGGPVLLAGAVLTPVAATAAPTASSASLKVYVVGAVAHPGVYTLTEGDRIEDAVRAAGGALADADLDSINLSARVHDEEQIRVPQRGETPFTPAPATATPPPMASAAPAAPAGGALPAPGAINLNRADAATLATLPGIGPVLAGRIVADRAAHGAFARIEDIQRVSGIGPAIFEKIRPDITVGP